MLLAVRIISIVAAVALGRCDQKRSVRVAPRSGLTYVRLEGADFQAGCEPGDGLCDPAENPRSATVGPFWIGRTEVTVEAFRRCLMAGACTRPHLTASNCNQWDKPLHPINCIDWYQARAFCEWDQGRLPTADEWEFAAKGAQHRIFPWGDEPPTGARANYCDRSCPSAMPMP